MPLAFGIIGTNWITDSFISSAHATQKWQLRAVYSRQRSTASDFAAKYNDESIALFTDLSALAADPALAAIYIASPNILHAAHAAQMLSAGKHVILEKPICSNVAELDALFELAKRHGVFLIEAWRHIQEGNFKILKSALDDKKLGTLYGASLTYAQFSSRYDKVLAGETPNIFNLEMGGGALVDLGVYTVAAAVWLFGAPKNATYWPVIIRTGADGGGKLVLEYEGFSVYLCSSKLYNSDAPSEVYGEKGTLIVPTVTDVESVVFWDPRSKTRVELGEPRSKTLKELNLKEEAEEFARIIETKDWEAARVLERHSREVLRVTEKVRRENGLLFPGEK